MQQKRIDKITEALYTYSASVLKEGILQFTTIEELFELSLHTHQRTAFRSAWALEHVLLGNNGNQLISDNAEKIIDIYVNSDNWSVLRSISKVLIVLFKKSAINIRTEVHTEKILNKTFDCLENTNCPIAVRCNMYDIIYLFIDENDWLISELRHRIQLDISINETPALKSRAKRILKKLERIPKS
ncbi:hypothetical protein [Sphingobacterium bovistauri]|uniref:Adenylosuccinate lyase n=1 Tax=Sphingobacterium bovistauri TaxID=2781959 RepID=A0ABS7Z466_9SPHI|nr:hypothetical protein [Sphingobacterium bovistauri]MCA5003759.1 hypothetical protein [Sphingobacterium bovistauri]